MPCCYGDYFELKTIKDQKTQEEILEIAPSHTPTASKNLDREHAPGKQLSLWIITL